jgi:hypothetical protein
MICITIKKIYAPIILCIFVALLGCSSNSTFFSQSNDPEPEYRLFDLLDEYPALYDAVSKLDQHTFNIMLADAVNANVSAVKEILPPTTDAIPVLVDTIGLLRQILYRIMHQDDYDWPGDSYANYTEDLYSFLDSVSATSPGVSHEIVSLLRKVLGYIYYAHGNEIETVMDDLNAFLQDTEGQNLQSVFPDLQEALGKLLLRTNTTIEYNGNDLHLGNAVEGVDAILSAVNDIATKDEEARDSLYNTLREIGVLLTSKVGTKSFAQILQELLINAEDYATLGGAVYSSDYNYHNDNTEFYVNTELSNGLRQFWPGIMTLFIKAKGSWDTSNRPDYSPIYDPENGESVLEYLTRKLYNLKLNCGIDLDNYYIEDSLKRMVTYNAYGQPRNTASYKVSYLDHLLFTLIASYDFGFKTRLETNENNRSGEPYTNASGYPDFGYEYFHWHGEPTGGILTVNDCLYSLTSGEKNAIVADVGAYELSLDPTLPKEAGKAYYTASGRTTQCNYVFRSSFTFTSETALQYKFPMGYDFPSLALLSGFSAGDVGIPNGGKAGIIPTQDTTGTDGSNNDYRTYYPYVGNGLGELNTGRWVMGWIARACWEGEGPYYYADPNAPTQSINGKTYYAYFRPDGRIYALVYKPSNNPQDWEYFYPVDGGNDVRDSSNTQLGSYYLRANRYRAVWETDKIMLKAEWANSDTLTQPLYYTLNRVVGNTGLDKYRLRKINGPENTSDDEDAGLPSGLVAGGLTFKEKIPEKSSIRECKSQEEAMFRNFQWLILEKKIVFIMPMRSYITVLDLNGDVTLDPLAVAVLEANGIIGMKNLKKGNGVGYWNIKGNEGTDVLGCTGKDKNGNTVNYGDSYELGDGRIFVLVREDAGYLLGIAGSYVDLDEIWNTILGNGAVTPAILAHNLDPIARMAFIQPSLVLSDSLEIGNTGSSTWQNRSKLLPIVIALAGDLHEKSYYQKPLNAYDPITNPTGNAWYNFSGNHKYPLKHLRDLIAMLDSPMVKYYKQPYSGASKGWFVPQINNPTDAGKFAFLLPQPIADQYYPDIDFRPNAKLRSVVQVLTESGANTTAKADGLLPALTNTKLVSQLLSLLQKMGKDDGIYRDEDKTSSDYTQWGARRKFFYGLEQIVTRIKCNKSIELQRGYYNVSYPDWMFTKDDNDLDLDKALEELIGYDAAGSDQWGKGLAAFVDHRDSTHPNYKCYTWKNFYKMINGVGELLSNNGPLTNGSFCITEDIITMLDKTLTSVTATHAQLKALRHTLGVTMTYYDADAGQWVNAEELSAILFNKLPQLLNAYKGNNLNLLIAGLNMMQDDGFVEYLLSTMKTDYSSKQVYEELYAFLGSDLVANPDSRLWNDVEELITQFAVMLDDSDSRSYRATTFDEYINPVYSTSSEYLYSSQFDPYSGLGMVLTK